MALAGAWLQAPRRGVFSFSDNAVAVIVNPDKLPTAAEVVILSKLCDISWASALEIIEGNANGYNKPFAGLLQYWDENTTQHSEQCPGATRA